MHASSESIAFLLNVMYTVKVHQVASRFSKICRVKVRFNIEPI